MAGDWIKIENVTPDKPEIDVLAELLDVSVNEVIGGLVRLWIWADQQTLDGNAPSVTKSAIDRHSGVTGLADAMRSDRVRWLVGSENGGFQFPNFDRHNGQTAKTRGLTAKRVAKSKKRSGNAEVTPGALPREQRTENRERVCSDHRLISCLRDTHTLSAATDWCRTKFLSAPPGKRPLFSAQQASESREFLLRVAAIALSGEAPEAWAADAINGMRSLQKPPSNPGGYLRKVLGSSIHIRAKPPGWFEDLLKRIEVPPK